MTSRPDTAGTAPGPAGRPAGAPAAAPARRARVLGGLGVPTRDGLELTTDVFLPAPDGAWPVVVVRTPYNRSSLFLLRLARTLNGSGLAVLVQDCRGRFGSPGRWDWRLETSDGHDCLR